MFSLLRRKQAVIHPGLVNALDGIFSDHELAVISRFGTVIDLDEGAVLAAEGTVGREALIVLNGTAVVSRGDEIVATVGAGSILGEMALLNDEPRNATLVATSPLTVVVMHRQEFTSVLRQCPRFEKTVRETAKSRAVA
jgi:CRP-like cAMP-binding protein